MGHRSFVAYCVYVTIGNICGGWLYLLSDSSIVGLEHGSSLLMGSYFRN